MDSIILEKGTGGETGAGTGQTGQPTPGTTGTGVVDSQPSFTDDTELWKDEEGKSITYKEAKGGYLRQADYTKKTTELAEGRKELETFKGWLDNPNMTAFDKVKFIADQFGVSIAEAKAIKEGAEEAGPGDLDPDDPKDRIIMNLMKKVDGFEKNLGQRDITSATREIESEVAAVKDKYKEIDDEELKDILSIAQANKGENLTKVADRYFGRLEKRDKTKLKTYLEGKERDGKKVPLVGGGIPSSGEKKKLSLEDGSAKKSLIQSLIAGNKAANE